MSGRVTVATAELRHLFGAASVFDDRGTGGRMPLWRMRTEGASLHIAGFIDGCECAATVDAEVVGQFDLRVGASLLGRLVKDLSDGTVTLVSTPAGLLLETASVRLRLWAVKDPIVPMGTLPTHFDARGRGPRVDAGVLRRAVRVAAAAASEAQFFGVAAVQIALGLSGFVRVSATDHYALSEVVMDADSSAFEERDLAWRVSAGARHLRFAMKFLGGRGQAVSIEPAETHLDLISSTGRVRLPIVDFPVPTRADDPGELIGFRVRRSKLLASLDPVSHLAPGTASSMTERMVVTLAPEGETLVISGGTSDVGDVRVSLPLETPLEAAPFKVRRIVLENWLRAVDAEFVDIRWAVGSFARRAEAVSERWVARLVLATMR